MGVIQEVVTFGSIPYKGLTNAKVLDYRRNNNCLAPPSECKPAVYVFVVLGCCIFPSKYGSLKTCLSDI